MADMPLTAPAVKPANPNFSSGPCAKRPGWTVNALADALVFTRDYFAPKFGGRS